MSDTAARTPGKSVKPTKESKVEAKAKQVKLRLVHIDVWSATKVSFFVSLALAILQVVATFVLMVLVHAVGLFDSINEFVASIVGTTSVDVSKPFDTLTVTGFAMLGGIVLVVLGSILGAIWAFVFNAIAHLTSGLRVSFANDK